MKFLIKHINKKKKYFNSRVIRLFVVCFCLSILLLITLPAAYSTTISLPKENDQITWQKQLPNKLIFLSRRCPKRPATADSRNPTIDPLVPYIISPRRTLILNSTPQLSWNAVPGVTNYTVSLLKGEETIWQTTLSDNQIIYPGEPPLETDAKYLLVVEADNGKSSQQEEVANKQFSLLPIQKAEAITTAIEQLQNLSLTDKEKAFLSAYLYIGAELNYEAIKTLEALIVQGFDDAEIYQQLGELYWQIDVTLLAESNYLEAEKQAITSNSLIEKAQVQEALAEIYLYLGDDSEALLRFQQAQEDYQTLGDMQKVKELEIEIQALSES